MTDPRIDKLAHVLINYSCEVKPGESILVEAIDVPHAFTNALVRAAAAAGGRPLVMLKSNEVQRALALAEPGDPLVPAHFSERLASIVEPVEAAGGGDETLRQTLGRIEAWLIRRALEAQGGRRAATARRLGITREGLYK